MGENITCTGGVIIPDNLIFSYIPQDMSCLDVYKRQGVFVSLVNSIQSIYSISFNLSDSVTSLSRGSYQMEYFEKFFSMSETVNGTEKFTANEYKIVFDHVGFSYPNTQKRVLSDVTFEINPGEKICIVGRNGAGKSTIIKLLCGLYQPDSGTTVSYTHLDVYKRQPL